MSRSCVENSGPKLDPIIEPFLLGALAFPGEFQVCHADTLVFTAAILWIPGKQ